MDLKVLGNAGHPASLKTIMKLLPGFGSAAASIPLRLQIDAVLALRNIAKKEPKMMQEMAVQLFMEKALQPELRMAAAIVMFETKLPMGLVTTLADALLKEQNLQVASFVYSYMKAMTKTTAPDFASFAAACDVALKILSPKFDKLSSRYSRAFYYDTYHSPLMMGAAASAYYINDVATVMPKAIVAKARTYLAGAYTDILEVQVVDWMRGKTCGLCGMADGEIRMEYHTPNQRVSKSSASFAHSWVLPGQSCHDASECYIGHESVKLAKQVSLLGQVSKCYSVEPVLRCLPGCMPLRTTYVHVGYHCLPIDTNLSHAEGLTNIYEKSIDLRETAEAHLACRCTPQCA